MIKKIMILVVICLISAGVFFFLRKPQTKATFETSSVARGDIKQIISATGTIQAVNTVDVGTQVSGTINKINVDYNSSVKKGEIMATIDPVLFKAEVNKAKADVSSAKAGLSGSQASLNEANRDYKRKKILYDKKFIAASEMDSALATVETSRAQVQSSKASVQQAQASLDKAMANLNYTTIVAPLEGVVVDKDVSEGQTVAASYSTPTLFTIAEDLTKMQVETDVDEADIGYIKDGMKVNFTVDTYPEETFTGYVYQVRLQSESNENVVTYTVVIYVDNPDMKLKPGMTANVDIEIASVDDVLKVATSAFRFSPPGYTEKVKGKTAKSSSDTVLWVFKEDEKPKMHPVRVKTGLTDGSFTEVSGELEEGYKVVTSVSGLSAKKDKQGPHSSRRRMF